MHRQSLGSSSSKLHSHGVIVVTAGAVSGVIKEDSNNALEDLQSYRKDKLVCCSAAAAVDDEHKSQKSHHKSILLASSSRLVHLIPLLTFVCFLILYLSSHDPSRKELAQFSGFTTLSSKKAAIELTDIVNYGGRFLEIEKNDVLAIRNLRNLQQQQEIDKRRRLNRKFRYSVRAALSARGGQLCGEFLECAYLRA